MIVLFIVNNLKGDNQLVKVAEINLLEIVVGSIPPHPSLLLDYETLMELKHLKFVNEMRSFSETIIFLIEELSAINNILAESNSIFYYL